MKRSIVAGLVICAVAFSVAADAPTAPVDPALAQAKKRFDLAVARANAVYAKLITTASKSYMDDIVARETAARRQGNTAVANEAEAQREAFMSVDGDALAKSPGVLMVAPPPPAAGFDVSAIKAGMSYDDVKKALGRPSHEDKDSDGNLVATWEKRADYYQVNGRLEGGALIGTITVYLKDDQVVKAEQSH